MKFEEEIYVVVLFSSFCPLDCDYCWITKEQKEKPNDELIEKIRTGELFEEIGNIFEGKINELGFFGGEPIFNLEVLNKNFKKLKKNLPKVEQINLSSSLIKWQEMRDFIEIADSQGMEVHLQVSLDGPDFIMDENRFSGGSEKVKKNLLTLLSKLGPLKEKPVISINACLTGENIKILSKDQKIGRFISFFDRIKKDLQSQDDEKNILFHFPPNIEVALPGDYSKKDGKRFKKVIENLHKSGYHTRYFKFLYIILGHSEPREADKSHFTCRAADNFYGYDGKKVSPCNKTFLVSGSRSHQAEGNELVDKNGVMAEISCAPGDKECFRDLNDTMEEYHSQFEPHLSMIKKKVVELAEQSQIRKEFKRDSDLLEYFSLFLVMTQCPIDAVIRSGSLYTPNTSFIKLFGNGAFEKILAYASRAESLEEEKLSL